MEGLTVIKLNWFLKIYAIKVKGPLFLYDGYDILILYAECHFNFLIHEAEPSIPFYRYIAKLIKRKITA